ncbi:MAG: hypothetical protein IAE78_06635 [Myxococcus sp.]|nr:hypothetical protein [Myxococcus sp.]
MMLQALVLLVSAQRSVQMPARPAPRPSLATAVRHLADPRTSWEQRLGAMQAVEDAGRPLTEAQLKTLQVALGAASQAPSGACPPDERERGSCGIEVGPCLSPAGFILAAVAESAASGEFVDAALRVLDEGKDPWARPIARRLLGRARHARAEREAQALLELRAYACVGEAARILAPLPRLSSATRALLEREATGASANSLAVAELVASRAEPWAEALVERLLRHADVDLRLGAVRGRAGRLASSPGVREALAEVARCDAAAHVRKEALDVHRAAGVEVKPAPCAAPEWTVADRVVRGKGLEVTLRSSSSVAAPSAACAQWAGARGFFALGTVGAACVVGIDRGEFGGGLLTFRAGQAEVLARDDFLNPVALLRRGHEVLVMSALDHLGGSGGVGRVSRDDGATLSYERLMRLPGRPSAWATVGDRLFVSFDPESLAGPCASTGDEVTYVFEADGAFSLARGAATRCRWP